MQSWHLLEHLALTTDYWFRGRHDGVFVVYSDGTLGVRYCADRLHPGVHFQAHGTAYGVSSVSGSTSNPPTEKDLQVANNKVHESLRLLQLWKLPARSIEFVESAT